MAIIVGIKFRNGNKVYYFDPQGIAFDEGDGAIVETARGQEFGTVSITNKEVDEKDIVSPLKPRRDRAGCRYRGCCQSSRGRR